MTISKAPWTRCYRGVYDANDHLVAMCFGGTPDEAEENTQLASVAPEMLEALEGTKWLIDSFVFNPAYYEEYQDVCKVIKKAEGRDYRVAGDEHVEADC